MFFDKCFSVGAPRLCRKRAASLRGGVLRWQGQERAIGVQFWIENKGAWD